MKTPLLDGWPVLIPTPKELRATIPNREEAKLNRLREILKLMGDAANKGWTVLWVNTDDTKIDREIENMLKENGYYVDIFNTRLCSQMCIQWGEKYECPIE